MKRASRVIRFATTLLELGVRRGEVAGGALEIRHARLPLLEPVPLPLPQALARGGSRLEGAAQRFVSSFERPHLRRGLDERTCALVHAPLPHLG